MAGKRFSLKGTLIATALASLAAVGTALVSQHVFYLQPCPWCALQRVIFVLVAAVALLGAALPARAARVGAAGLVVLLALSGAASALWQHFVAAVSTSCKQTLADKLIYGAHLDTLAPDVFAPRATCADAAVNLLGIPYDFWSLGLFALLAVATIRGLQSSGR